MEAMEALPEMKLPAETETDEYAKRIAYWKEQATTMPKDTGSAWYAEFDLRRKANAVKLLQCERDIVAGIRTIGEQFLVIGKNLTEIQAEHLHLAVPMRDDSWIQSWSFEDYVARNFGFKKSTAYSLIGVYREFGTATCKLKEEYAGFGYSQLVEMLPMSPTERQKVTAGMTVKEIREIRQNGERRAAVPPKPIEPAAVEVLEDSGRPENENQREQASPVRTSGQASPVCNIEEPEIFPEFRMSGNENNTEQLAAALDAGNTIAVTFNSEFEFLEWCYDNSERDDIYPLTIYIPFRS